MASEDATMSSNSTVEDRPESPELVTTTRGLSAGTIEWVMVDQEVITDASDFRKITAKYTLGLAGPDRPPIYVMSFFSQANKKQVNLNMYVPRKMISINHREALWMMKNSAILSAKSKRSKRHEVRDEDGNLLRSLKLSPAEKGGTSSLIIEQEKNGKKMNFTVPFKCSSKFFGLISSSLMKYEDMSLEDDDEVEKSGDDV